MCDGRNFLGSPGRPVLALSGLLGVPGGLVRLSGRQPPLENPPGPPGAEKALPFFEDGGGFSRRRGRGRINKSQLQKGRVGVPQKTRC